MKKKIVIIDLDGTIVENGNHADLDAFYAHSFIDDKPITETVELVKHLGRKYDLVYCTARSEKLRAQTLNWLDKHGVPHSNRTLLMRSDADYRPTVEVKLELIKNHGIKHGQIAFVLEDNNHMVRVWRDLGVRVLQVDNNDI